MIVAGARQTDAADWGRMRLSLWPSTSLAEHAADIAAALDEPAEVLNLIARTEAGLPTGFAEASLRHDYVNGCKTSPVAFLEGIYVEPQFRGQGIARLLVDSIQSWALHHGCSELASDANIGNLASHGMHNALGFVETQRVVYFRKLIS